MQHNSGMSTSRDLKSGEFCHADQQSTSHFSLSAHSTSPPPQKAHPLSFNVCFSENPRRRNALRNGETSLKNCNCFNLESLRSGAKYLLNIKSRSKWFLSRRFGDPYGRLGDSFRIRETPRYNPRVDCLRKVKHLLGTNKRIKSNKNDHLISWCDQVVFFC